MKHTFTCRECRGEITADSAHSLVLHAMPQCGFYIERVHEAEEGHFDRLIGVLTVEGLVQRAIARNGGIAFLEGEIPAGIVDSSLEKLGAGTMLAKVLEIYKGHPEYDLQVVVPRMVQVPEDTNENCA